MNEKEWKLFNDLLLEVYYSKDIQTFGKKCLSLIKLFISYDQGHFVVLDVNGKINESASVFENVDDQRREEYVKHYFDADYLTYLYSFSKTMCYRDTDILSDENRMNSEMYINFIKPQNLDLGCGMIIMQDGKVRALFNLLRNTGKPDVSNHEMEILEIFKLHFEKNILYYVDLPSEDLRIKRKKQIADKIHLSEREQEIVELIIEGYSNNEVSKRLHITTATVKKHLSNIYEKTGVNRRIQLVNLWNTQNEN